MKQTRFLKMKNHSIAITILVVVITLGTWLYAQHSAQQHKQALLQESALFENKAKCEKLAKGIKRDIDKDNAIITGVLDSITTLKLIFYSPNKNSCLYTVEKFYYTIDPPDIMYSMYDALTRELLKGYINPSPEDLAEYAKFVFEYSGGEIKI